MAEPMARLHEPISGVLAYLDLHGGGSLPPVPLGRPLSAALVVRGIETVPPPPPLQLGESDDTTRSPAAAGLPRARLARRRPRWRSPAGPEPPAPALGIESGRRTGSRGDTRRVRTWLSRGRTAAARRPRSRGRRARPVRGHLRSRRARPASSAGPRPAVHPCAIMKSPPRAHSARRALQPASARVSGRSVFSFSKIPSMTLLLPANNASGPPACTLLNGAS